MKDYKQVSESVFRKAEERMNEKKRRAAVIWRRSLIASGMAAVLLVGVGVWKNESIRGLLNRDPHSSEISVIEEETTATASATMAVTTETDSATAEKTTKQTKTTTTTAVKTSSGTSKTSNTVSSSADSTSSEKADGNTSHANGGGTTVRTEQNNTQRTTAATSTDKNTSAKTTQTTSRAATTTTKRTSVTTNTTTRRNTTTTTSATTRRTNTTTTRQTYIPTIITTTTTYQAQTTTWYEPVSTTYIPQTTTWYNTMSPYTTTVLHSSYSGMQTTTTTTTTTIAHTTAETSTIYTEHEFTVTETEAGKWEIDGCPPYCDVILTIWADEEVSGTLHVVYEDSAIREDVIQKDLSSAGWSVALTNFGETERMTVYFECDDPSKIHLDSYRLKITHAAYLYQEDKRQNGSG